MGQTTVGMPAIAVYLRKHHEERWWVDEEHWSAHRDDAKPFRTNVEALLHCREAKLSGLLVGFNAHGREIYQLDVDRLLDRLGKPLSS
jgi:hypothetical protein